METAENTICEEKEVNEFDERYMAAHEYDEDDSENEKFELHFVI